MMIRTICPAYLGSNESIYQTAPQIAAQSSFHGYYSYNLLEDCARGVSETRSLFEETGLIPTGFRIPIELGASSAEFQRSFAELRDLIASAHAIGYTMGLTWIMPGSNEILPVDFQPILAGRLQRIGRLLEEFEIQLAVELVAPYAIQQQYRYPIPVTMDYLLHLIAQTEQKNIGVVLDNFHFYCAGHTIRDYALLKDPYQIKMVHLSDGVPHRTPQEQQDLDRRLPGETGVIDCNALLQHLQQIQYCGPVIPEPLDTALACRPFSEMLQRAAASLDRIGMERI